MDQTQQIILHNFDRLVFMVAKLPIRSLLEPHFILLQANHRNESQKNTNGKTNLIARPNFSYVSISGQIDQEIWYKYRTFIVSTPYNNYISTYLLLQPFPMEIVIK